MRCGPSHLAATGKFKTVHFLLHLWKPFLVVAMPSHADYDHFYAANPTVHESRHPAIKTPNFDAFAAEVSVRVLLGTPGYVMNI